MDPEFRESVDEVRRLAARGDYTAARRRIAELEPGAGEELQQALDRHTRTLEVLESIDVVRGLLRDGDTAQAGHAAHSILDTLSSDDYADLGVAAAALALIGRADELASRLQGDESDDATREELDIFVEYLGAELNHLGRDSVDRQLEALVDPSARLSGASTLGDILSNRTPAANITPSVEASSGNEDSQRHHELARPRTESPVIGRILIEQEERERVSTIPETAVGGDAGGEDLLGLIGRAALQNWYVVAFCALIFAAFGYLGASSTPSRYVSSALVQKTRATKLRAPVTGETREYLPSLPSSTVLELVKVPMFHKRVSATLAGEGWQAPGENEAGSLNVPADTVGGALSVRLTNTEEGTYLIEFTAVHNERLKAQAIAGVAAEEFRRMHVEHVSESARANLADYEERSVSIETELDKVYDRRLAEFAVEETQAAGVSVESRVDRLVRDLHTAREDLDDARIQLRAFREELDTQINIAERLPEFESPETDARIESRRGFLDELERELYELARKRESFGEKHPVQDQIKELEEDIKLVRAEIRELEKGDPEDIDERDLNPVRAIAEDRVAKARSRVSIQQDKVERLEARVPALQNELDSMRDDYLESRVLTRREEELLSAKDRTEVVIEDLNAVLSSADRELVIVAPAGDAREIERETLLGIAVGLVLGLVVGLGIAIGLLRRRQARHGARVATA